MFRFANYAIFLLLVSADYQAVGKNNSHEQNVRGGANVVLWKRPPDISSEDLFYGPGGKDHQPKEPFVFIEEDMSGSNPKFELRDANGILWRVKLGQEAKPETVATRLVRSMGYFADEVYFLPQLRVSGLKTLSRGQDLISSGGVVRDASLKRKDRAHNKIGEWSWKENPFVGTQELNGLRVIMALVNNWDLKTSNNAVYQVGDEQRYLVKDLGGTFGRTGSSFTRTKSDIEGYAHSKFIKHISGKGVDFYLASRPFFLTAVYWPYYQDRAEMEGIVQKVPLPHVEWISYYLTQLLRTQLEAAFRSAGYSSQEVAAFVSALQRRISELHTIREGGPNYSAK